MKTTVYITTRFADADDAVMCVKDLVKGTNLEVKAEKVDNDGVPAMYVNVYGDKVAMDGFVSAYKDSFANIEDICDIDPMGWTDPVDLKYYTKDESKQGKKNEGPGAGYTVTIKDMEISDEPKVEYDENKGVFTVEANVEYEANAEGYDWSTDYVMHDVIGTDVGTFPHNPYKGVLKLEMEDSEEAWGNYNPNNFEDPENPTIQEKLDALKYDICKGASFNDFDGMFGGGYVHSGMSSEIEVSAFLNWDGVEDFEMSSYGELKGTLTIDPYFIGNIEFAYGFSGNLYELVEAVKEYLEGKGVDMDTVSDEQLNDILGSWVTDEITSEYIKEVVTNALSFKDFVDENGEPVVLESKQGEARIPSDVFDITDNTKYILNNDSDGRHPVKSFVDEMAQRAYAIASNSRDYTHESVKSVLAKAKRDYWGSDMTLGREYQDELKVKYPDELRKYYAVCRSQGFDFLPKDFDAMESVDSDGFFGWLVSALSGKLLKFAPSDKFESKQEEADYTRANKPVADAYKVLDNYYMDNGKLSDFLTEQVLMTYKNDGAMYSRSKSKAVKSHSLAWESLLATINALLEWDDETEHATKLTSEQVKNWFKANGMDYKEALKPLVDAIENQRKEWFGESKKSEGVVIPKVSSDAIHSKSVQTGYYTDNSGLCHIYVDGVEKDIMDFDKAVDAGYNLQESKKSEKLTQKDLKQMATSGAAIDITNVSDEEAKEIRSRKLNTVAISRGTYGMNGALLKDKEGKTYVITARNSNLFYFV